MVPEAGLELAKTRVFNTAATLAPSAKTSSVQRIYRHKLQELDSACNLNRVGLAAITLFCGVRLNFY